MYHYDFFLNIILWLLTTNPDCTVLLCLMPVVVVSDSLLLLSPKCNQYSFPDPNSFYTPCKHTHKSGLSRGRAAVRKDLQRRPVLPAVGWLEGQAVFVKVMGPRWANSQGTHSVLCHLRITPHWKRGLAGRGNSGGGGGGTGREGSAGERFLSSPALSTIPRSASLWPLQPHLKVITRTAVSKQAPYGETIVVLRLELELPSSSPLERRGLSKHS